MSKTFTGSAKAVELNKPILVVCQKSKVKDWLKHFKKYYCDSCCNKDFIFDLTKPKQFDKFIETMNEITVDKYNGPNIFPWIVVGVINYDLIFRRSQLHYLRDFTLMLDESSMLQNEKNNRAKFILNDLCPINNILLSGTPINGKYEKIWSQCKLLGWKIDKTTFEKHYCVKDYVYDRRGRKILGPTGFPVKQIVGYKNVERLKSKLREYGCHFLKTEQVFDLPEQMFYTIEVETTRDYTKFINPKYRMVDVGDRILVGDTSLTRMLYQRMLCGQYNQNKLDVFEDLIASTEDRIVVFYNFTEELTQLKKIVAKYNKPTSEVNGSVKNLENYEDFNNTITFVQYQAGSMGLNLQLANKMIYFTPPLSSEFYEQSKKRIHRIGQNKTCFYYNLVCKGSIEEKIYRVLATLNSYTLALFEEQELKNE